MSPKSDHDIPDRRTPLLTPLVCVARGLRTMGFKQAAILAPVSFFLGEGSNVACSA